MADIEIQIDGIQDIIGELKKMADDMKGSVKAGVIETSKNYKNVIEYAPIQEFGGKIAVTQKMRGFLLYNYGINLKPTTTHITIPPRSFMRETWEEHSEEWLATIAQYLKQGISAEITLEHVGRQMVDDIIDKILSNMPPPLSPMTRYIKSFPQNSPENADRSLYATGQLAHSIHHEVFPDDQPA